MIADFGLRIEKSIDSCLIETLKFLKLSPQSEI